MTYRTRAVFFDLGGTLFSNLEILRICTPLLPQAARRLGSSVRTRDRWTRDPDVDLPRPRRVLGRRRWWRDTLISWIEDHAE